MIFKFTKSAWVILVGIVLLATIIPSWAQGNSEKEAHLKTGAKPPTADEAEFWARMFNVEDSSNYKKVYEDVLRKLAASPQAASAENMIQTLREAARLAANVYGRGGRTNVAGEDAITLKKAINAPHAASERINRFITELAKSDPFLRNEANQARVIAEIAAAKSTASEAQKYIDAAKAGELPLPKVIKISKEKANVWEKLRNILSEEENYKKFQEIFRNLAERKPLPPFANIETTVARAGHIPSTISALQLSIAQGISPLLQQFEIEPPPIPSTQRIRKHIGGSYLDQLRDSITNPTDPRIPIIESALESQRVAHSAQNIYRQVRYFSEAVQDIKTMDSLTQFAIQFIADTQADQARQTLDKLRQAAGHFEATVANNMPKIAIEATQKAEAAEAEVVRLNTAPNTTEAQILAAKTETTKLRQIADDLRITAEKFTPKVQPPEDKVTMARRRAKSTGDFARIKQRAAEEAEIELQLARAKLDDLLQREGSSTKGVEDEIAKLTEIARDRRDIANKAVGRAENAKIALAKLKSEGIAPTEAASTKGVPSPVVAKVEVAPPPSPTAEQTPPLSLEEKIHQKAAAQQISKLSTARDILREELEGITGALGKGEIIHPDKVGELFGKIGDWENEVAALLADPMSGVAEEVKTLGVDLRGMQAYIEKLWTTRGPQITAGGTGPLKETLDDLERQKLAAQSAADARAKLRAEQSSKSTPPKNNNAGAGEIPSPKIGAGDILIKPGDKGFGGGNVGKLPNPQRMPNQDLAGSLLGPGVPARGGGSRQPTSNTYALPLLSRQQLPAPSGSSSTGENPISRSKPSGISREPFGMGSRLGLAGFGAASLVNGPAGAFFALPTAPFQMMLVDLPAIGGAVEDGHIGEAAQGLVHMVGLPTNSGEAMAMVSQASHLPSAQAIAGMDAAFNRPGGLGDTFTWLLGIPEHAPLGTPWYEQIFVGKSLDDNGNLLAKVDSDGFFIGRKTREEVKKEQQVLLPNTDVPQTLLPSDRAAVAHDSEAGKILLSKNLFLATPPSQGLSQDLQKILEAAMNIRAGVPHDSQYDLPFGPSVKQLFNYPMPENHPLYHSSLPLVLSMQPLDVLEQLHAAAQGEIKNVEQLRHLLSSAFASTLFP